MTARLVSKLLFMVTALGVSLVTVPLASAGPLEDCRDYEVQDLGSISGICIDEGARPEDIVRNCWTIDPSLGSLREFVEGSVGLP